MMMEPSEIERAEEKLRAAMLASDVAALDALIADDLLFIGPQGSVLTKGDDLGLHRSGAQRMTAIDVQERLIQRREGVASVTVLAFVSGVFMGHGFQGRFRYLRVWHQTAEGWKVVAGSVSKLDA